MEKDEKIFQYTNRFIFNI